MTSTTNPSDPTLADVLTEVRGIRTDIDRLDSQQHTILTRLEATDLKFEAFQKGTDGVVRMATNLLTGATISIIVGVVLLLLREAIAAFGHRGSHDPNQ